MKTISRKRFLAFVETKTGPYNYGSNTECPLGQFLNSRRSKTRWLVGGITYKVNGSAQGYDIPLTIQRALIEGVRTWEALAERLRA